MKRAAWHKTVRARRASVQRMNSHTHTADKLLLSGWSPKQKNERTNERRQERREGGTEESRSENVVEPHPCTLSIQSRR